MDAFRASMAHIGSLSAPTVALGLNTISAPESDELQVASFELRVARCKWHVASCRVQARAEDDLVAVEPEAHPVERVVAAVADVDRELAYKPHVARYK